MSYDQSYYSDPAYAAWYAQYYAQQPAAAADYSGYYDPSAAAASSSSAGGGGPIRTHDSRNASNSSAPYPVVDPKEAFKAAFGVEKKERKGKAAIRVAGGQVWEDPTLLDDWDPNDFRIFCGDLGNEVTDNMLESAFKKYPSFQKARVVRDKKTGKSKGFGFVSLKDPNDYMQAMREMNNKYVGSRPIKLRKSNWKERTVSQKQLKKVMEDDVMKLAQMASKKR